jgi:glyoxylase-like metal-dependent hydrolase (beta-lactamase superfamily II)
MYGIEELTDSVVQIALPPHADIPLPWGYPHSVYLLRGESPSLIDTGHPTASDALLEALRALDVAPERIHRILLTGTSPGCVGNLSLFPRALPVCTKPSIERPLGATELELERISTIIDELLLEPTAPDDWDREVFDEQFAPSFRDAGGLPKDSMLVADGDAVAAGQFIFDALAVSGSFGSTTVYYAADKRVLFPGSIANVRPRPMIRDATALLESLDKIESLSTGTLYPSQGTAVDAVHTQFRSAHLYVTNLRTNLQYLLNEPRTAGQLAAGDLGYWPKELIRFAGLALTFRQLLEEHVRAGVAVREDRDGRIFYRMGTEQSRHRMM